MQRKHVMWIAGAVIAVRNRVRLQPVDDRQRDGAGRRPRGGARGRSLLAEAAPQQVAARPRHRRGGRLARPHLGAAPAPVADGQRARRRRRPADVGVLRAGAGRHRVRPGGQRRPGLGRPRRGLRVAQRGARHLRRPPRQRVDRRQRAGRRAGAEVLARRDLPAADRERRPAQRQPRHDAPGPRGRHRRRRRGQRGLRGRRLRQPARHRLRRRHRRVQAPLGRLRPLRRTTASSRPTTSRPTRRPSSATPSTACSSPTRGSSTSATG